MRRDRDVKDTQEVQQDALQQDVVFEEVELEHRLCLCCAHVLRSRAGGLHGLSDALVRDDKEMALPFKAGEKLLVLGQLDVRCGVGFCVKARAQARGAWLPAPLSRCPLRSR